MAMAAGASSHYGEVEAIRAENKHGIMKTIIVTHRVPTPACQMSLGSTMYMLVQKNCRTAGVFPLLMSSDKTK